MQDKEIKQLHQAKVQRWDKNSESAKFGGYSHDAVNLAAATLTKAELKNRKKLKEFLTDRIKIFYEIYEELTAPQPVDAEKSTELWDEKKQELADEESQLRDINTELQEVATTTKEKIINYDKQ